MSSNTSSQRPFWVIPLICFLAGLLIGWWLIGWMIWPVQWMNALPADLRAAERDQYLAMAAESYAASRNADLARDRLSSWPPQELATHLAGLQARTAGTPQQAQVQALAELVGAAKPAQLGAPTSAPAVRPTPASGSAAGGGDTVALLRRIGTILLWLVLLAVAIATILYFWSRWRATQGRDVRPAIAVSPRTPRPPASAQRSLDEIVEAAKSRWPEADSAESLAAEADEFASVGGETAFEPPPAVFRPVSAPPIASGRPAPRPVSAKPPAGTAFMGASEYQAHYRVGEPDYDEAFDISDASGGYLGQCGLELTDPVGRAHDQAAALQAWLWDTNDPDTKVKVLMSEGAYRDTAMRDQLKGEHDAIPVRAGTEFELESYKLLLRGYVEKAEYAEQDPPYTMFSELVVRFQVQRKA